MRLYIFLSLKVTFSLNKFLCSYVTFSLTIDIGKWHFEDSLGEQNKDPCNPEASY